MLVHIAFGITDNSYIDSNFGGHPNFQQICRISMVNWKNAVECKERVKNCTRQNLDECVYNVPDKFWNESDRVAGWLYDPSQFNITALWGHLKRMTSYTGDMREQLQSQSLHRCCHKLFSLWRMNHVDNAHDARNHDNIKVPLLPRVIYRAS